MKKQLKEELVALAEKVALLKDQDQVSTGELKELARRLFEKLTIYNFTESNLYTAAEIRQQEVVKTAQQVEAPKEQKPEGKTSEVKNQEKKTPEKKSETVRQEENFPEPDEYNPTGLEYNDSEAITEPNTEKIKDIVAQMPPETQQVDDLFAHIEPRNYKKNDMSDIGGVHYDNLPQFEPVKKSGAGQDKPRSLNDRLKKGINIGLNDRMAFVKHLFDGSTTDYNRVLSQLNTIKSKEEASNFVANMVKPDYNNWEGKEDYESRFLAIVEKSYE
ncbi:hypothetical protein [Salinimicrobium terrae]|uniref:hypothetical protein n=1 Tax=Salinimicrobium terrae TaxID=470866 RepID=UPI00049157CF|nr:hypothetical protein [Salinimicrobium terrae]